MEKNIFRRLRETTVATDRPVGRGHNVYEEKYYTQAELARRMGIEKSTVDRAENIESYLKKSKSKNKRESGISIYTLKRYHEYFDVPYETLLGESDALKRENVDISSELGLTDEAIDTIKKVTGVEGINYSKASRLMFNAFIGNEIMTPMFFDNLARDMAKLHQLRIGEYYSNKIDTNEFTASNIEFVEYKISKSILNYVRQLSQNQLNEIANAVDDYSEMYEQFEPPTE